ncbi:hypothetical protein C5167_049091 [Papaver somniferum]|uniref:Uncharacterized protein n=1 Tax=Papaver somniferum TaxID=3469 RepID=A0A4Y7KN61_PAPSO|nr:hypothetical protein C5167_049091 [Papaver somniferum]
MDVGFDGEAGGFASVDVMGIWRHVQKYFQKLLKNGTSEHLPPPMPKRKAVQPYPQKAAKMVE